MNAISYVQERSASLPGAVTSLSARETFHIEILGEDEGGSASPIQQRVSVRTADLEGATERAIRLFARARTPQRRQDAPAEAVRVIDGAGREVFRRSRFDEPDT